MDKLDVVKEKTPLERLFIAVCAIILMPFSAVITGWCIMVLWSWALVPIGVPEINILIACMISMLYNFIDKSVSKMRVYMEEMLKEKDTVYIIGWMFGKCIIGPPVVVGLAWITKLILTPLV